MRSGEFDFYGETMTTLMGSTDPEVIAKAESALKRYRIPYAVDASQSGHPRIHIPAKKFDTLDPAFWDDVHGPEEPIPDPYSFRQMVQEMQTSARTRVKSAHKQVKKVARRGANTVARRAAPHIARRYGGNR